MELARTDEQVDEILNKCTEAEEEGSAFPGCTYEQGVAAAIRWLIGDDEMDPLAP